MKTNSWSVPPLFPPLLFALAAAPAFAQLAPGEAAMASRAFGSVYGRASLPPAIAPLLSGPDGGTAGFPVLGAGPSLAGPSLSIVAMPDGRIVAAPSFSSFPGRFLIDPATGNRTVLPGTTVAPWTGAGELIALDNDTILALADDFNAGPTGDGKLIRYHLPTATSTLVSGIARGNGPVMHRPRSLARLDENTVLVGELGPAASVLPGAVLYSVNLATGDRTLVSTIAAAAPSRFTATNGVRSANRSTLVLRGTGPTLDAGNRGLAVLGSRVFVAGTALALPNNAFPTGILEIDLTTGNRTLVVGTGVNGSSTVTAPTAPGTLPVVPDSPTQLLPFGASELIFTSTFGPSRIWALNPDTKALRVVADLDPQILPPRRGAMQFSGLALAPCAPSGGAGITILNQPVNTSACPGGAASLEVVVAPGVYLYQWRRNGTPIDPASNPSALTPRLAFAAVGPDDGASYDCVITSACGSVTTDSAALDFCPADVDCSGFLDSDDFVLFLDQYIRGCVGPGADVFGPNPDCLRNADFDLSGFVDADDFVVYLAAYGQGC
ncbi:MAG: GC-type dockerin domain-anchored protein [Planctomycetota bacterium]|nr:GC-type dockerin domain-anchored protein [Planctomycetota bacterium]